MEQITERIISIGVGEQIPQEKPEAVKIMLLGSEDTSGVPMYDWQGRFMEGLKLLTDPVKGLIMYKNLDFVILNPKGPVQNPSPTYDNQEFHTKVNWILDNANNVDMIVLNMLKKSTQPFPLYYFGFLAQSGKMIVRCPSEYFLSGLVKISCEKFNIPLLEGKTTVKDIMLCAGSYIGKFRDQQKYQLPD
jgi:hypothetical protein